MVVYQGSKQGIHQGIKKYNLKAFQVKLVK